MSEPGYHSGPCDDIAMCSACAEGRGGREQAASTDRGAGAAPQDSGRRVDEVKPSSRVGEHGSAKTLPELKYSCGICGRYMDKPCEHWAAWIANPQPTQPVTDRGEGVRELFKTWWLSEGIHHMPKGDQPPEHAAIAELAWLAAWAKLSAGVETK